MSKITVIVGQSGKSGELYRRAKAFSAGDSCYSIEFNSWKYREPDYSWVFTSGNFDSMSRLAFFFDNFDVGLDHRLFRDVLKTLLNEVKHPIYLVVYTLDMIDALLDEVPHEDLTFVRVRLDGTCIEATAEEVAVIRETWGGDIR